ncbi:hypothetical protein EG329_006660 [Mollisiaceae sp. DMI_Dod_QoI]|nr:hypothetical protein EG329_006660 [Helotiales sp. DMI_Dod_QoI]
MSSTKEDVEASVDEASANHPEHGLILPGNNQKPDALDEMAFNVLNDNLYNIVHDLLMTTYREEKTARCNTAAILLEQKAQAAHEHDPNPTNPSNDPPNLEASRAHVQTDTAYFDKEGNTSLHDKVDIMQSVAEVYCPDCRLPRFPYPTEGEGRRTPAVGVQYCKKRVFVKNWPADVYNQRYAADKKGPGKGNGKKKAGPTKEVTPSGSQDSPTTSPPANDVQDKPIPLPSVKCPAKGCTKHLPVSRVGAHLARDHGSGRRAANRDALERIQNNSGYASSGSRNATPAPVNGSKGRSSPNKRDLDDLDSEESPQKPKKAKAVTKKLKAPSMSKTSSQLSSSNLNHVETQISDDDYEDDGDDHRDGDFGTISVDAKKKKKAAPKVTKSKPVKDPVKNGDGSWLEKEKKKKATKTPAAASKKPRPVTPPDSKANIKNEVNGHGEKPKGQNGTRGESDSSQTLSSPN